MGRPCHDGCGDDPSRAAVAGAVSTWRRRGPGVTDCARRGAVRGSSDEMRALVDLWFAEEREHSRLLSCAVRRFGGRLIQSHWSFSAFCATRRVLGVWFELQVLLLTEIVSTCYYRVLRRHR